MKVTILLAAEMEIGEIDFREQDDDFYKDELKNPEAAAQAKFDAFREATRAGNNYGICLFRIGPSETVPFDHNGYCDGLIN